MASLLDARLLGYENPIAWSSDVAPRGVHEVRLMTSLPYLFVNERYSGNIKCFDRRNMSRQVYSVYRASQTQQVRMER